MVNVLQVEITINEIRATKTTKMRIKEKFHSQKSWITMKKSETLINFSTQSFEIFSNKQINTFLKIKLYKSYIKASYIKIKKYSK